MRLRDEATQGFGTSGKAVAECRRRCGAVHPGRIVAMKR